MALNQLGLGFVFTAKDLTKAVVEDVSKGLGGVEADAEGASKGFEKSATSIRNVGIGVAAAGAASLAFLGYAADKAEGFSRAIDLVATRVDAANFPIQTMQDLTMGLAAQFGGDAKDNATALYSLVGKGARDAASATAALTAANNLAKSTHTDLAASTDALALATKAFGLSFLDSAHAADVMFIASKNSGISVTDLSQSLEHLGPGAARAGISLDQMVAGLSAANAAGLQGRAALGGMKGILDALVQPSADASAEARRLGVSLSAANIKSQGLSGILAEVTESSNFNAQSFAKLFGSTEAVTTALALAKNQGKELNGVLDQMANASNTAADAAANLIDPGDRFIALKNNFLILVGQAIKPTIDAITNFGNKFLEIFNKLPKPVIKFLTIGAAIVGVILLVTGTVMGLAAGFVMLDTAIFPVIVAMAAVLAIMALIAIAAAPIVVAIYGLKLAFDKNLGGIADKAQVFWNQIKLVYDGLTQLFEDGGFSGAVMADLNKAQNGGLKNFIIGVFTFASRIQNFFDGIGKGFSGALEKAGPIFSKLGDAFVRLGAALSNLFGGKNDPAKNAQSFKTFGDAGSRVGEILEKVVNWFTLAIGRVVNFAAAFAEGLAKFRPTFDAISNAMSDIGKELGQLFAAFGSGKSSTDGAANSFDGLGKMLGVTIGFMASMLRASLWLIEIGLKPLIGIVQLVGAAWTGMKNLAMSAFQEVIAGLIKMAGGAAQVADKVAGFFGKDLGATTQFVGLVQGMQNAAIAPSVAASSAKVQVPTAGGEKASGPSVAQATASQQAAASNANAGGAVDVSAAISKGFAEKKPDQTTVVLQIDSDVVATAIAGKQGNGGARAFQPGAPAT